MAATPRSKEAILRAAQAFHQCGTGLVSDAARALGWPWQKTDHHLKDGVARGLLVDGSYQIKEEFEISKLPDEELPLDELLASRHRRFERKKAAEDFRRLIPIKVTIPGPYAIAHFGDPHVDDDGTDLWLLERHMRLVRETEGLFGGSVGDMHNNWVGRLAALYGEQTTSAVEAWMLVEWFVRGVTWLYLVGGNHDCWSGAGDPVRWMTTQQQGLYQAYGVRLALKSPNGREIRINARHDFNGHSQWNTVHGAAKAVQMGWRDHILTCGHKHTNGYNILKCPATGLVSHALRICSYKTYDRYAAEKGLPDQNISPCVVTVVDPDKPDNHPGQVTVFHDPEAGARYLTMLRAEWKARQK